MEGNLVYQFVFLLNRAIRLYELIILLYVLCSWMRWSPYTNSFAKVIYQITDPFVSKFRFVLSGSGVAIDVSAIIAIMVLELIRSVINGFFLGGF